MDALLGALLLVALAVVVAVFVVWRTGRRRSRPGPDNNWKNEAFAARERTGSWVENETWVGHNDADPSSAFPGTP
jgi:hypothetical protein